MDLNSSASPARTMEREIPEGPPEKQLVELRKMAVEQGIPLPEIDKYLLDQEWVPIGVKKLIREQLGSAVSPEQSVEASVSPGATGPTAETQPSAPSEVTAVKGSVEIFDAKKRMEEIKAEVGAVESSGIETGQVTPETETEQVPERAAQTAEGKEQTTTGGTQDLSSAAAPQRSALGVFGYAPSPQIANNASSIAEKGDVKEAGTWQALMLQRLWEMWGSIKALFSPQS